MTAQLHNAPTYEEIIDSVLHVLRQQGALPPGPESTPWNNFVRLSDVIHSSFVIPSTTFTPIMRRLLFALGYASGARNIVGIGTFVGYTFSWLLGDRADSNDNLFFEVALGIDVDGHAVEVARRNCAILNHGERLKYVEADGPAALAALEIPIDLLYLDLDDPVTGKFKYQDSLRNALPRLRPGALVLAHDACLEKFADAFAVYHDFIRACDQLRGPWILPIDSCGLSLTVKT